MIDRWPAPFAIKSSFAALLGFLFGLNKRAIVRHRLVTLVKLTIADGRPGVRKEFPALPEFNSVEHWIVQKVLPQSLYYLKPSTSLNFSACSQ